ncbi:MAG: DNA polymerase III subunit gamma/tau [Acidimicrobiales bacterium]
MTRYQALYRKYRPQRFDEVIGQDHVVGTLSREVTDEKVAHAYLFAGPRGTGKTTTARLLAKSLNCTNRTTGAEPCNECASCLGITEGTSLDVIELDAASHNKVEDVREIRVNVGTVAAAEGARRIYILDEAHMLSRAAGNALLKTLEEPPEHVVFVLATTEPYKLLDTIRSRSQRFDFHPVTSETLIEYLAEISEREGFTADHSGLSMIATHARGSVRDSMSLLEQVAALGDGTVSSEGVTRALGLADDEAFTGLVTAISNQDAPAALGLVAQLASRGADLRRFVADSLGFFRGIFLAQYAPNLEEITDEPPEILDDWRRLAKTIPSSDVLRAIDLFSEALLHLRQGREERLMLELAVIRLTRPETTVDAEALAAALPEAAGRSERPIRVEVGWAEVPPPFTDDEAEALLATVDRANGRVLPTTVRGIALDLPGEEFALAWRSSDGGSELVLELDETVAQEVLESFVAERTNIASQGGRFEVVSGEVQIILPEESEVCCDPVAVASVEDALLATDPPAEPIDLPLRDADDEQARAELEELGINELVASFTTNHACCQNRVENIHRIADITRGVVIRPGATFSVNNYVGRRTEDNGFVSDGVIQDGVFEKQVGGGISQYATTLFNSAFRAGLDFGEYQSHSLYISRYPYGVEATLSYPHPDLQIINSTPYGVLLWPSYTGSSITINLYSTKHINVEQTGQTESAQDQCTRVTTTRKRTYDDGTAKDDSVFAVYRPGEGLRCDGSSTVTTTTSPPPPPSTEPPPTTEPPPPATTAAPPPVTEPPPTTAATTTTVAP